MQVVILAAGSSSRFYPFNIQHKACFTLLGKTILEHTIISVKNAGYTDIILIVDEKNHIQPVVGDGSAYGVNIQYVIQKQPTGAGEALLLAKEYIHDDFFVIWGSRVEFGTFVKDMVTAKKEKDSGVILIKQTENIAGVGVVALSDGKLVDIVEKPDMKNPPSHLKIIGVYLLPKAFFNTLETVATHHYSFEEALVAYAKQAALYAVETEKEAFSLKYPWDILGIKSYLLQQINNYQSKTATIAPSAILQGNVYIEDGAKIMEHAVIKGPCYIGKDAFVGNNAILRDGVVLEQGVTIGTNMEVKNTVISQKTSTHSGFIGDSVIGKNCKIAGEFSTANVRLDRTPVAVTVGDTLINSHQKALGVFIGDDTKIGIRVSTMPGIIIGKNVIIGPQTTVMKNVTDDTKYYTKFQEVVEKNI